MDVDRSSLARRPYELRETQLSGAALAFLALASTALYAACYFVALRRVTTLATSPYGKASPVRRSAAAAVDLVLVCATAAFYTHLGA